MPDTLQRDKYRITELLLFLNNDESYCLSADRYYNDSLIIDGYEKILKSNTTQSAMDMARIPMGLRSTGQNYLIRKERNIKTITYFNNIVLDEMYYQEPMNAVKWELKDSSVNINGFECKAATKRYLGRNYIAFYAPSIPIQDGPLKFNGLPGLIVHIKDDKEEVVKEDDIETETSEKIEEEEEVEEEVEEEEEEELFEIEIDDVTYCTNNDENGFIYQLSEDGDVGDKVGYLKDGEAYFD
jgi:GLPGLI family protein